jgi:hypothetical protein
MIDGPHTDSIAIVAGFSSIGGIAYHLWFGRTISVRQWIGALLLSGFCGALTYLWLFEDVSSHLKLIVVSILAGIGGTSLLDLAIIQLSDKVKSLFHVD